MKLQKKIASLILNCGKRKIWIDPNEKNELSLVDSRYGIIKMIKNGYILKKNNKCHSRSRIKFRIEKIFMGKNIKTGKKKGTLNARASVKNNWIFKQRTLRNFLKKYKEKNKINKHFYRNLYKKSKGNAFKNKKNLMDYIKKSKTEIFRKKALAENFKNWKNKQKTIKNRKILKLNQKMKIFQR